LKEGGTLSESISGNPWRSRLGSLGRKVLDRRAASLLAMTATCQHVIASRRQPAWQSTPGVGARTSVRLAVVAS